MNFGIPPAFAYVEPALNLLCTILILLAGFMAGRCYTPKRKEVAMADFSKLNQDIATVSGLVDALIAQNAQLKAQLAAVVDEQPAVDQADAAVTAIAAKIPA